MKTILSSSIFYAFVIFRIYAQPMNESPEELYSWGIPMEVSGIKVVSTKPANGYVVLQNGERRDGLLKLKKTRNELTEIQLKIKKKEKFNPNQVSKYGLNLKMSDLTKNGEKVFNDEGKNFKESSIMFTDGREESGFLAFQSNQKFFDQKPEGAKDFYVGFYFTPSEDVYLTSFPIEDIKKIIHNEQEYYPINGGFVSVEEDGKNKIALFQKGTLVLKNSQKLTGEIRQKKIQTKWYTDTIYVKTSDDEMEVFGPEQVESFTQVIDQEERVFINIQNVFIEKLFDGNTYVLYRNPFPSESKLLTAAARSATIVAADEVATKRARKQFRKDARDDEGIDELAESYYEAKETQLDTFNEGVEMSEDISIKKKEYIVHLKSTGQEIVLSKGKYRKWFAGQASRCSNLSQEALKAYSDLSQIIAAIEAIDSCE
ncbi:MAG: hypothetical protein AAF600_10745 [Bacteroidota bacterium]